jgi:hypothetical protein
MVLISSFCFTLCTKRLVICRNILGATKGVIIITKSRTYFIQLLWDPQTIQVGKDIGFGVIFQDNSQNILNQVSYSFRVTDSSGKVLTDLHDQKATDGTGMQTVQFDKTGPANVLVSVDGVAGNPSGEFVENANFHVVAVG